MHFKKIDPKQTIYHHFELSPTEFVLYDSEWKEPIIQGSKNLVEAVIRNLKKSVTICYYKLDVDKESFKLKAKYTGKIIRF
jgi:hypothetical protein